MFVELPLDSSTVYRFAALAATSSLVPAARRAKADETF
jgi:hypothetical protein